MDVYNLRHLDSFVRNKCVCVCVLENKFILKLGSKCIFAKRVESVSGWQFSIFIMVVVVVVVCSSVLSFFLENIRVSSKLVLLSVPLCLQLKCLVACLNVCVSNKNRV